VSPSLVPEVIEAAQRAVSRCSPARSRRPKCSRRFARRRHGEGISGAGRRRRGVSAGAARAVSRHSLVPTGGVTLDNIAEMFKAGAAAVGVGTELISKDALARRDYARIGAVAKHSWRRCGRRGGIKTSIVLLGT